MQTVRSATDHAASVFTTQDVKQKADAARVAGTFFRAVPGDPKARGMCGISGRFEIAALGRPRGHLAVAPCKRADAPGHWDLSDPWRRGTA
jgi:hypothetical protein